MTIGLEAMCAADFMNPDLEDRFVHAIAHEYGHIQQPPDTRALEEGMPGATLLRMALIEGAAEFTAENPARKERMSDLPSGLPALRDRKALVVRTRNKSKPLPAHPRTPDNRYMVVRGRLWRLSNPTLDEPERLRLVSQLMDARRAISRAAGDAIKTAQARKAVHHAKIELGERGSVWWDDGAPDYNRHMAINTPYAEWFRMVELRSDGKKP